MKRMLSLVLLGTLATAAGAADNASVEELVKSSRSWTGAALPAYPDGEPEIRILRITIPPGTRLPLHTHPVINAGVLLEGTLIVETPAGDSLTLEAGDPIVELVNAPHSGTNPGDTPAVILVFYAGSVGEVVTETVPE